MSVVVGAAISPHQDPLEASIEAARGATAGLRGADADLALVFASGSHLLAPQEILDGVHSVLAPNALVGCGAGGARTPAYRRWQCSRRSTAPASIAADTLPPRWASSTAMS